MIYIYIYVYTIYYALGACSAENTVFDFGYFDGARKSCDKRAILTSHHVTWQAYGMEV